MFTPPAVLSLMWLMATPVSVADNTPESEEKEILVEGLRARDETLEGRSTEIITAREVARRQARSTPDALKYTPGVYIQQTGHGQASPYVRGLTGQQVLLVFDGMRINNALFRQGPNQYLFTVDSRTVDRIEVVRGSAGVILGADALGGAVMVKPRDPLIDPFADGVTFRPAVFARHATADREAGGRLELDTQFGRRTGLLVGMGYREAGRLESSGPLPLLLTEEEVGVPLFEKEVPTFAEDGRTMLGTGFREFTADARLVHRLNADDRITVAAYVYRQFDSPRTDQCPPPEAPLNDCLVFTEQFRTHLYSRADLMPRAELAYTIMLSGGFQRQHEKRERDRSDTIGVKNGSRDALNIWGATARIKSKRWSVGPLGSLRLEYGADGTWETVQSAAWTELTRLEVIRTMSRGLYLDGSRYAQGGVWASPRLDITEDLTLRTGVRFAMATAKAPGDEATLTRPLENTWWAVVSHGGVTWRATKRLTASAVLEQGYRPPNLDDLTARQQTGQGFQLENPNLAAEKTLTAELALKWAQKRFMITGSAFQMWGRDFMERRPADCPETDRECRASRSVPVTLINVEGDTIIRGAEAVTKVGPFYGVTARATIAYAWGETQNPIVGRSDRVPRSRIPPLNGTAELMWGSLEKGIYAGGAMRWATVQDRLSVGDAGDTRIPFGGTPGYEVFDLRAGVDLPGRFMLATVLENVTDQPYRTHGSAVNGPGRGFMVQLEWHPGPY
ncbi:MAG: TonB-dependent receptor [Bradymonadia bacterium]